MPKAPKRTPDPAERAVLQTLEALSASGVTHLPRPRKSTASAAAAKSPQKSSPPRAAADAPAPPQAAAPAPGKSAAAPKVSQQVAAATDEGAHVLSDSHDALTALSIIAHEVAACTLCSELASTRHLTVFGSGNPRPRLVFMGEAPGADEDRQGLPFVGRAGQLLTKIIEACTLSRDDVYILNTLKCRPPQNRTPLPHEVANCRGFLDRQLAVLKPEFICCLGAVAAQNLLGTTSTIGRLRGTLHEYNGISVLCTYHPAYLLRNPPAKKDCWQDMQLLMREMGISLPNST